MHLGGHYSSPPEALETALRSALEGSSARQRVSTAVVAEANVTKEAVVARQAQVEPQPSPVPGKPTVEPTPRPPQEPDWWAQALIPLDDVLELP